MALRPEYSLINSEFNDFLFAVVGEEKSGMQLTVLTALTRLNLDPWREAARLSELPKGAAINALAATISALPEEDLKWLKSRSIAERLVGRLPNHVSSSPKSPQDRSIDDQKLKSDVQKWLVWIALAVAVLVAFFCLFSG